MRGSKYRVITYSYYVGRFFRQGDFCLGFFDALAGVEAVTTCLCGNGATFLASRLGDFFQVFFTHGHFHFFFVNGGGVCVFVCWWNRRFGVAHCSVVANRVRAGLRSNLFYRLSNVGGRVVVLCRVPLSGRVYVPFRRVRHWVFNFRHENDARVDARDAFSVQEGGDEDGSQ